MEIFASLNQNLVKWAVSRYEASPDPSHGMQHIKVIYVNDGPGLLLGSMWNDYSYIEDQWPGRVKVVTLRMVPDRITAEWLGS